MHDAQNLFDKETSYVGEWKIDEYLDTTSFKEVIIVGIEHGNEERINELTPYKNEEYGGGKGEGYLGFIIHNLKPHIDASYRTLRASAHTSIFGSSLGGLISFYAAIKYPNIFGNAGVFSPAFWINPEIYDLVRTSEIKPTSRFFFLAGTDENEVVVPNQNRMIALLKEKGVANDNIINNIIEGGTHNESFWSEYFPEAHRWLIQE